MLPSPVAAAVGLPLPLLLLLVTSSVAAKPSILLMFPDELRYDWGGTHNNPYYGQQQLPLHMPNIDALAKRGVRFTRAVVPSPVCAPSRACLASGREYDPAAQGANGMSVAPSRDGDFDVEEMPTFYQELQRQGYYTMVTGRDDLTKRTGPGLNGQYHTAALGFNDSARCAGSVDVTWGECGSADNGAAPCAGIFAHESETKATVHEPYGAWLAQQNITDPAVRDKYTKFATNHTGNVTTVTNYFELDFWRYAELTSRGAYDSVHWYAIPDTLPFEQRVYQVRKRIISFAMPFYTKNAIIYQDGLVTNMGKVENERVVCRMIGSATRRWRCFDGRRCTRPVGETASFAPFYAKRAIILPRQARDNHRKR
jgi:hypothetical protein